MSEKEFDNFLEKYTDPPEPSFLDKITSYFDDRTAQVTQDYNIGSDPLNQPPKKPTQTNGVNKHSQTLLKALSTGQKKLPATTPTHGKPATKSSNKTHSQ